MTFIPKKRAPNGGFTLIELMITLAIIALLATVAFPAYQDQLRKSKRAEGKTALLKAAQLEERAYTSSPTAATYASDLGPLFGLGTGAQVRSGETPTQGNYDLTVAAAAVGGFAQGFTLTATPRAGVFDDPWCGPLTLDSTGTRGFTSANGKGTQALCW